MINKKLLLILIAGLSLSAIVFFSIKNHDLSDSNNNVDTVEINLGTDVCAEFPKEKISSILGKEIVKTEEHHSGTTNTCQYYVDNNNFVTLRANSLNVQSQKDGQTSLGRTITTDPSITMEHFVVKQENGLINEIVLVLNPNLFLAVDRSSTKGATEVEIVELASGIGNIILSGENQTVNVNNKANLDQSSVPLPQATDIVRNFFNLINEGRVTDAVETMSSKAISDDSQRQAWGAQFNSFEKISIVSIEPSGENQYKVVLNVKMKPESANAVMPYYGYFDGNNTRWILLEKENGLFKVSGISTGP